MRPTEALRTARRSTALVVASAALVACGQPVEGERWGGVFERETGVPSEVPPPQPLPEPPSTPVTPPPPTGGPAVPDSEHVLASLPEAPTQGSAGRPCGVRLTEFKMAGGTPAQVTPGDAGSVWFTDPVSEVIGHLTGDGAVRRYRLPAGSTPGKISRGPDGNYWFVDARIKWSASHAGYDSNGDPSIGRITPEGRLDFFPLPTAEARWGGTERSQPVDIVAGPDQAMWVTEMGANKIARVALDGKITEYDLPSRQVMHAMIDGIVTGPDGAIWFQQALRNSLGRLDPATGRFDEFPKLDGERGLVGGQDLTVGADGALWFAGSHSGDDAGVNRMTLDGRMTHVPLPGDRRYRPSAVTADRRGGMWFIDDEVGRPVHVTATGEMTAFGAGGPPVWETVGAGIATAEDGTVWYTRPEVHTIGRIACF